VPALINAQELFLFPMQCDAVAALFITIKMKGHHQLGTAAGQKIEGQVLGEK